jgi:hypothetical protein
VQDEEDRALVAMQCKIEARSLSNRERLETARDRDLRIRKVGTGPS